MRKKNLRLLPSVDKVLQEQILQSITESVPHSLISQVVRVVIDDLRRRILAGEDVLTEDMAVEKIAQLVYDTVRRINTPSLSRVINCTGIILHTGLGRAVLSKVAYARVCEIAGGYCNLETEVESGQRSSRQNHFCELLAKLCGAEAALAVNNNAGSVLLTLNTLAYGKEVIVSRGQLVEIGGSFRLPDIMAKSGARLIEVGTTNRTRLSDYERAISPDTALILRVHTSNFQMVGYSEQPPIEELVELGHRSGIPVVEDVGSGAIIDMAKFGLRNEPTLSKSIEAGVDVAMASGDKLMGGPQAGLIVGRKSIIQAISENPLSRCLRIDKMTVAALEATLKLYLDAEQVCNTIPTLKYITRPIEEIKRMAHHLVRKLSAIGAKNITVDIIEGFSEVGGGSLPGQQLPTQLVAISSPLLNPSNLAKSFRMANPPVFGRVAENRFLLDLRTVEVNELPEILKIAERVFHQCNLL